MRRRTEEQKNDDDSDENRGFAVGVKMDRLSLLQLLVLVVMAMNVFRDFEMFSRLRAPNEPHASDPHETPHALSSNNETEPTIITKKQNQFVFTFPIV